MTPEIIAGETIGREGNDCYITTADRSTSLRLDTRLSKKQKKRSTMEDISNRGQKNILRK